VVSLVRFRSPRPRLSLAKGYWGRRSWGGSVLVSMYAVPRHAHVSVVLMSGQQRGTALEEYPVTGSEMPPPGSEKWPLETQSSCSVSNVWARCGVVDEVAPSNTRSAAGGDPAPAAQFSRTMAWLVPGDGVA
jgi:hypothetical protein